MRAIYPPRSELRDNDRLSACREALEPAIWQLIDRAKLVGWKGPEAALAAALVCHDFARQETREQRSQLMLDVG